MLDIYTWTTVNPRTELSHGLWRLLHKGHAQLQCLGKKGGKLWTKRYGKNKINWHQIWHYGEPQSTIFNALIQSCLYSQMCEIMAAVCFIDNYLKYWLWKLCNSDAYWRFYKITRDWMILHVFVFFLIFLFSCLFLYIVVYTKKAFSLAYLA